MWRAQEKIVRTHDIFVCMCVILFNPKTITVNCNGNNFFHKNDTLFFVKESMQT
jgi:hypothetical protein